MKILCALFIFAAIIIFIDSSTPITRTENNITVTANLVPSEIWHNGPSMLNIKGTVKNMSGRTCSITVGFMLYNDKDIPYTIEEGTWKKVKNGKTIPYCIPLGIGSRAKKVEILYIGK
jgi:hypothetical protein